MRNSKTSIIAIPLILLILALTGCSAITSLQLVVDAGAAALPVLQAAGVAVPPVVLAYVGAVETCVAAQNGSTAPTAQQILAIAGCLGTQVAPDTTGLSSEIANVISALAKAVSQFLSEHATATAGKDGVQAPRDLSKADAVKFQALKVKAAATVTQLKALKR